jgi:tetratricopeptide (TPR) repeat protein
MKQKTGENEQDKRTGWTNAWWTRAIAAFMAIALVCSAFLANAVQLRIGKDDGSASESVLDETTAYLDQDVMARAGDVITQLFTNPRTFQQYYQNASILIGRAKYEEALKSMTACISLANTAGQDRDVMDELWLKRACLETLTGRYDEALASFDKISMGAYQSEKLLVEAQIYSEKGDAGTAAQMLEEYLRLQPEDGDTRLTLAGTYLQMEEYDEAIAQYDAALAAGGDSEGAVYMQRASAKLMAGYYEAAIADFLNAKNAGYADQSACLAQCALASYLLQDYERVLGYGARAIAEGSDNFSYESLYYYMGLSQMNLGSYPEAADLFSRAIELGVDMDDVYYYRGACYMVNGDMPAAIADFTEVIERDVAELLPNSYFNRGVCAVERQDYDLAKSDFEMVIRLEPEGELCESAKTMLGLL